VVVVPKVGWRDPKGHLRVEDAAIYVHITYLYNSICIYIYNYNYNNSNNNSNIIHIYCNTIWSVLTKS
jgi:hypothetical protein